MNISVNNTSFSNEADDYTLASTPVFSAASRDYFSALYPEKPGVLDHALSANALLTLDALAKLGAALPETSVEYNPGDLPIGIAPEDVTQNGLSIADTILNIESCASWAVLKNIEQMPKYKALLLSLLEEIRPLLESKTGKMLRPQGYIFISSPGAVTPYHFDPEHNILLQLRGSKTMTVFPAGDTRFAPDTAHENYHTGGPRNLIWRDEHLPSGTAHHLVPGKAIFVPVMAPHFVRNGPEPSISLSITWRSDWSFAEADARALNAELRRWGVNPRAPGRFPAQNQAKSFLWCALRKAGIAR